MSCDSCKANFRLVTFVGSYKGSAPCVAYAWASEEICLAADEKRSRAKQLIATARALAMSHFSTWWHNIDKRNKKSVWRAITDDGKRYPALGTFYEHIRQEDLHSYAERYYSQHYLQLLDDHPSFPELEATHAEADQLHTEA